ncbi:histidine kinase [Sphingobium sp. SCG-1]|uniref:sensor histidine kinase n=1 Tax=Sphingobium sp. SCG-1 TaxID=2072936 RepID=UPI000CD6AC87|nr:sensor histidine kinase [Sphingobium sp. SCG-1]AUW60461.1 histidine kinase [Sphingobium sp. SCG-1]
MFLILALALLPLGLVALMASVQAIRTADAERRAVLQIDSVQSARTLASLIASDQMALQVGVNAFSGSIAASCPRLEAIMRPHTPLDTRFAVYSNDGDHVCTSFGKSIPNLPRDSDSASSSVDLLPERNMLMVRRPAQNGALVAVVYYGRDHLRQIVHSTATKPNHRIALTQGSKELALDPERANRGGGTVESVSTSLDRTNLILKLTAQQPPRTFARVLLLLLPILMWFSAAAIGWFVVNRLLIQPLVMLRRVVATYQPGIVLHPLEKVRTPAQEITDLGETFHAISEDVATHEAEMAESLVRQRKLTREVHHRVKNNLQIISSLINLHSRSAATPDATEAYGSIQRRVDALSVVHRNHYAELEENRGVGIRALVSELSASLRASAPANGARLNIQIDSADLHVSQDVAVPVAFLTTELVELAMLSDPNAIVRISVQRVAEPPHRAQLCVSSSALRTTSELQERLNGRFDRVLTGLSRQLRAPLDRDEEEGVFCIEIAVLD